MTALDLSVLIVTFNSRKVIEPLLSGVYRSKGKLEIEVIVVDNCSTDGTQEYLQACEWPITSVFVDKNLGFAAGHERGLKVASGKWILFLNPDLDLRDLPLDGLIEVAQEIPDLGVLSVCLKSETNSLQRSWGPEFSLQNMFRQRILKSSFHWPTQTVKGSVILKTDWVSGAFMVCSRKVLQKTGSFDTRFFLFGEDLDLCNRMRKSGLVVAVVQTMSVVHFGAGSSGELKQEIEAAHWVGSILYYQKNRSTFESVLYRLLVAALGLASIALGVVKSDSAERFRRGVFLVRVALRPNYRFLIS